MEFRNAERIAGGIDLELKHPVFGWIRSTVRARDDATYKLYLEARAWLEQQRRW